MFLGNKWKNQSPLLEKGRKSRLRNYRAFPVPSTCLSLLPWGWWETLPDLSREACDSFWGGKDSVTPGNKIYEAKKKKKKKSTKAVNSSPPVYAQHFDPILL